MGFNGVQEEDEQEDFIKSAYAYKVGALPGDKTDL